ncbi:MAG: polysaccharide biosynthesis tyrosine autokinase [Candidatus Omnitrophica bacterium]|nr:polysaccharide biosynthesis tyrosine autokinase [Candidatus Omnitrophota bacterium]
MEDKNSKNPTVTEESFADILFKYLYILIKYKWPAIITFLVSVPLVFIFLKYKEPAFTPMYKTTAKLRVLAEGTATTYSTSKDALETERAETMRNVKDVANLMKSTVVLEKAIAKAYNSRDKDWILSYAKQLGDNKSTSFVVDEELNYIYAIIVGSDFKQIVVLLNSIIDATREELLNSKKLAAEEAIESLENQLKKSQQELEQAKLQLTKFIVENKVLSEAIEVKDGKSQLVQDVDKLALNLVNLRSNIADREEFVKEIEKYRKTKGDVETLKLWLQKDKESVDGSLIESLFKQEALLSELLVVNKEEHPDVIKAEEKLGQIKAQMSHTLDASIESMKRENEILKLKEEKTTGLIKKGLSEAMIEYSHLHRNVKIKEKLLEKVIDSLQGLNLSAKLIDSGTFTVVEPPGIPKEPFNRYQKTKTTAQYLLFAFIFGISAGIGMAIAIDYFAMTIKDIHEVEEALDFPIIGEIPLYEEEHKKSISPLPLKTDPHSIISEAFRGLRTNIKFRSMDKTIRTLLVTSLIPEEGKSFVCANLACTFAQTDKKVLVIDCDLRKSTLYRYYGVENKTGMAQLLKGDKDAHPVDSGVPNLDVLIAGKHPHNPSELLGSDKFDELLEAFKQKYDLVIIDSPPLFAVTDSTILIKKVDAVILTIRAHITPKKAIRRAMRIGSDIKQKILGIAFNGLETKRGRYSSYYYYKYDYYGDKKKT